MGITTARRTWDVERDGRVYHVEMEDEYFLGRRTVRVNGEIAYTGRTVLSDHSGAYQIDLGGRPAFLKITTNGIRYFYDLITDPTASDAGTSVARVPDGRQQPPSFVTIATGLISPLVLLAALVLGFDGRLWREPVVALAGVPVAAQLLSTTITRGAHQVEYEFVVGGRAFTHTTYVPVEVWESARSSGVVPVRYLAALPEVNGAATTTSDVLWLAAIAAVFSALLVMQLFAVASEFHQFTIWRRVTARGVETTARVTGVRQVRNQYLLVVGCVVAYAYSNGGAVEYHGVSRRLPLGAATRYPTGSAVRVRYDPDRPRDSILISANQATTK